MRKPKSEPAPRIVTLRIAMQHGAPRTPMLADVRGWLHMLEAELTRCEKEGFNVVSVKFDDGRAEQQA